MTLCDSNIDFCTQCKSSQGKSTHSTEDTVCSSSDEDPLGIKLGRSHIGAFVITGEPPERWRQQGLQ